MRQIPARPPNYQPEAALPALCLRSAYTSEQHALLLQPRSWTSPYSHAVPAVPPLPCSVPSSRRACCAWIWTSPNSHAVPAVPSAVQRAQQPLQLKLPRVEAAVLPHLVILMEALLPRLGAGAFTEKNKVG